MCRQEGHESKKLGLVGGLFVLSGEKGCVYLDVDVDVRDEVNATTAHESVAKSMKRYPDQNNDKTHAGSI